jgi:predicted transcriptional regulator
MSLRDIAALLEKNRIKRVPIVANGKLVGIVSRRTSFKLWRASAKKVSQARQLIR